MSIKQLNPYINLNGTAEQAIALYERALGARLDAIMRFSEMQGMKVAPEHANRIMHSMLSIGGGVVMVSDTLPDNPGSPGANVQICLHFDDVADMAKRFDALAEGGKVTLPPQDTFWGARFGMLTDVYGVEWMFSCELKKA
jgi:PhnB protein